MDLSRLNTGEKVAGVSGVLLFIFMFVDWYGIKGSVGGADAWQAFGFIDIVLLVVAVAAVGLALLGPSQSEFGTPFVASAIVTSLGALAVVLVLIRLIDPPDLGVLSFGGPPLETTRKIGVWLGLITSIGVAAGGYLAMRETGTSFSREARRFRGRATGEGRS
jgi:hypothetical protein